MNNILRIFLIPAFLVTTLGPAPALANGLLNLPEPGTMVQLSSAFQPLLLKGIKVHPENPFKFDFILDLAKSGLHPNDKEVLYQSEKMIKYFMTAMTVPDKDLWVNLSPYEKDRLIEPGLGQTIMGRDMLAQDYLLKQLTASMIYPEQELGKKFWNKVYATAQKKFGSTKIPMSSFNKVWIVADNADVFEHAQTAFVLNTHLKVMLDEDYLVKTKHQDPKAATLSSQIMRQVIIPEIEKEVNQGAHFSALRQIYHAIILASWYKTTLKNTLLNQIYSNKNKVGSSIKQDDIKTNDRIFQQYLAAYKKGVFNYIKLDRDPATQTAMPRKYFSGGLVIDAAQATHIRHTIDPQAFRDAAMVQINGQMTLPTDVFGQQSQMVAGVDLRFNYGDNEFKVILAISEIKVLDAKILKAVLFKVNPGADDQLLTVIDLTGDQSKFDAIVTGAQASAALFKRSIERLLTRADGNLHILPEEIHNLLGAHADLPEYSGSHTMPELAPHATPVAAPAAAMAPPTAEPAAPPARRARTTAAAAEAPIMLNDTQEIIAYYTKESAITLNASLQGSLPSDNLNRVMLFVSQLAPNFKLPDGSTIAAVTKQANQTYFPLQIPNRLHVLTKEMIYQDGKFIRYIFRGYRDGRLIGLSAFDWHENQTTKITYNKELSEQMSTEAISGFAPLDEVRKRFQSQIKRPGEQIYAFYDSASRQGLLSAVTLAPRFDLKYTFPDGQTTKQKLDSQLLDESATRFGMPYRRYNLITQERILNGDELTMIIFRGYQNGVVAQVSVFDWDKIKGIPVYNKPLSDTYTASEKTQAPARAPARAPDDAVAPPTPIIAATALNAPVAAATRTTMVNLIASPRRTIANSSNNRTVLTSGNLHRQHTLPSLETVGDILRNNHQDAQPLHLGTHFSRLDEILFSASAGEVKYIAFIAYTAAGQIQAVSIFEWNEQRTMPLTYNKAISDAINASNPTDENIINVIQSHLTQTHATAPDARQKAAGVDFPFYGDVFASPSKNKTVLPRATVFKNGGAYLISLGMSLSQYLTLINKHTFPLFLGTNLEFISFQEINDKIIFYGYKGGVLVSKSVFNIVESKGKKFLLLNVPESLNLAEAPLAATQLPVVSDTTAAATAAPNAAPPVPAATIPTVVAPIRTSVAAAADNNTFAGIPAWRNVILILGKHVPFNSTIKEDLDAESPEFFHIVSIDDMNQANNFLHHHGHNVAVMISRAEDAFTMFNQSANHPFPIIIKEQLDKDSDKGRGISEQVSARRSGPSIQTGALRIYFEKTDEMFTRRLKTYLADWKYPETQNTDAYTPSTETMPVAAPAVETPTHTTAAPAKIMSTASRKSPPAAEITPQDTEGKDIILIYGENVDAGGNTRATLEKNGFKFYKFTNLEELRRRNHLLHSTAWIMTTRDHGGRNIAAYLQELHLPRPIPLIIEHNANASASINPQTILGEFSTLAAASAQETQNFIYPLIGANNILDKLLPSTLESIIEQRYLPHADDPVVFKPAKRNQRDTVLVVGPRDFYYQARALIQGYDIVHVPNLTQVTATARQISAKVSFVLVQPKNADNMMIYHKLKSDQHPKALAPIFIANPTGTERTSLLMAQERINAQDAQAITLLNGNTAEAISKIENVIGQWPYETAYTFPEITVDTDAPAAKAPITPNRIGDRNTIVVIGEAKTLTPDERSHFQALGYDIHVFPYWAEASIFIAQHQHQMAIMLMDTHQGRNAFYRFRNLVGETLADNGPIALQFPFLIRLGVAGYGKDKKNQDNKEIDRQLKANAQGREKIYLYRSDRITDNTGTSILTEQIDTVLKNFFDADQAMLPKDNGGIDFHNFRINRIMTSGGADFMIDRAMIERFKNSDFHGFDFSIKSIQPADIRYFLGLAHPPAK